mmetsp:Transcript_106650/g.296815  ORF Transcript_106650/g.296815 Transcript_106650/m.296815 type:complete len:240 (+) Transcript_106650:1970-2689(+)
MPFGTAFRRKATATIHQQARTAALTRTLQQAQSTSARSIPTGTVRWRKTSGFESTISSRMLVLVAPFGTRSLTSRRMRSGFARPSARSTLRTPKSPATCRSRTPCATSTATATTRGRTWSRTVGGASAAPSPSPSSTGHPPTGTPSAGQIDGGVVTPMGWLPWQTCWLDVRPPTACTFYLCASPASDLPVNPRHPASRKRLTGARKLVGLYGPGKVLRLRPCADPMSGAGIVCRLAPLR